MANCSNMVKVEDLYLEGNCRSPECEAVPAMVESLRRSGFKPNHPLVVSAKPDGRLLVLVGNRRTLGLFWLRDNAPKEYKGVIGPLGGKVPAVVHQGLTVEEEVLLRIDHSTDEDRVPLDEWSEYLAIKQLTQSGMDTQEAIAEKLGLFHTKGKSIGKPRRSYVQPRANLARLPLFVETVMRQYTLDRDSTPLRWSMIHDLFKVHSSEFVEYPEGNGPLFTQAWADAQTPPEAKKGTNNKGNALTPKEAIKRAQATSSVGLSKALLAATGQGATDLPAIDKAIAEGETAIILLKRIADYLGEADYAQLVEASKQ